MKIFILSSRFPYPIEKGDKLRLYHQMRELSKRHELILFSLTETDISSKDLNHIRQFCKRIYVKKLSKIDIAWHILKSFGKGEAAQIGYFYRKHIFKKINSIIQEEQPDHIFCQLIRMARYVPKTDCSTTLDYMDAFSLGMERRSQYAPIWQKPFFRRESYLLKKMEREMLQKFTHHLIIAEKDKTHIEENKFLSEQKSAVPFLHLISNGIDTEYFQKNHSQPPPLYDIVFVGNMGYFPNVIAAQYIADKIYPLLKKKLPNIKILIAGASPTSVVKKLGDNSGIHISGWMPDIRHAYMQGKIFVAPLFTGSGQQNKILEAMAMEIPVVTTSIVNQAIGGEEGNTIFLAETPEDFAQQIAYLLENPHTRLEISQKAAAFIKASYSWEASVKKMEKIWAK